MVQGNRRQLAETKTCPQCRKHFSCEYTGGRRKTYCSSVCQIQSKKEAQAEWRRKQPRCDGIDCENPVRAYQAKECNRCFNIRRNGAAGKCNIEGCDAPAIRRQGTQCEMHYYRARRTGTTNILKPSYRHITSAGYINIKDAGHPLAGINGWVYEHRAVLYLKLGPEDQHCFWCDEALKWANLVVDHLNEDKSDNHPDNLVAACNNCNRARGSLIPFLKRLQPRSLDELIARIKDTVLTIKTEENRRRVA